MRFYNPSPADPSTLAALALYVKTELDNIRIWVRQHQQDSKDDPHPQYSGGGGNLDGGFANSVFRAVDHVDGGGASG